MNSKAREDTRRRTKRFMLVNRRAPHGTIYALEALEVALAAGAFDQDVSLVFVDDGVYQLIRRQNTQAIGLKDFARSYQALGDYGIDKFYVERESLQARSLSADDLMVPVSVVESQLLGELLEKQDVILSF
jgi:tRNA 2-thiouridine synthesizing protein C